MGILQANDSGGPLLHRQAYLGDIEWSYGNGGGGDVLGTEGIIQHITEETHVVAESTRGLSINGIAIAEAMQSIDNAIKNVTEAIQDVFKVILEAVSGTETVPEALNGALEAVHDFFRIETESLAHVMATTSSDTIPGPVPEDPDEAFDTIIEAIDRMGSALSEIEFEGKSEAAIEAAGNLVFEAFEQLVARVDHLCSITPDQDVETHVTHITQLDLGVSAEEDVIFEELYEHE